MHGSVVPVVVVVRLTIGCHRWLSVRLPQAPSFPRLHQLTLRRCLLLVPAVVLPEWLERWANVVLEKKNNDTLHVNNM